MMKFLRGLSMAGAALAFGLVFAIPAEAASHLKTINAAKTNPTPVVANTVRAQSTAAASVVQNLNARVKFVNYLLYEEAAAIQRNNALLNQRSAVNAQLTYLESLTPTNPSQVKVINRMIQQDMLTLHRIQTQLNMNYVHLTTTIPGIESAIAYNLSILNLAAPYSPAIARYVTTTSSLQQSFSSSLQNIITTIPASF